VSAAALATVKKEAVDPKAQQATKGKKGGKWKRIYICSLLHSIVT
jgi:hypothetical protein